MWVTGQIVYSLDDAAGGVKDLLTREAQPHLFDRLRWFETLNAHHPVEGRPVVARASAQGARCWLFLSELPGRLATAMANYYTLAYRPIFAGDPDPERRIAMLIALARRLRQNPLRLSEVRLAPVPTDDGSADLLERAFKRAGWMVFRTPATVNWTINVAGKTFDNYWEERPGALRSTCARKLKKSAVTTEIHTILSDEVWDDYAAVYAESWKPEEGSLPFLRAMAQEEAEAGCLRLGIARLDGQAVATQLWTLERDRAIIHKLAYREAAAEHSPGTLLTAAMFRHVIDEDHVALIDYGTGDDAYKADWMDTRNLMDRIECFDPMSAGGLWQAGKLWAMRLARRPQLA
jgi:hypothetical protein